MIRLRRLTLFVALFATFAAPDALAHGNSSAQVARSAIKGEHRVLVMMVTWGPQTFARSDVHNRVFVETNEWVRRSSYGLTWFVGDTTPWLAVFASKPECDPALISRRAREAARNAGFDASKYDRQIYLLPERIGCNFTGLAQGTEVFLNGFYTRRLVAHELGHTYGLGFHANTWECSPSPCRAEEYGDRFDTMGRGSGDFNAYEKFVIGWLKNVARPTSSGTFTIAPVEVPSTTPQALVISTARHEYWLDHRGEVPPGLIANFPVTEAVFVHAGPNPNAPLANPIYPAGDLLIPDPVGAGREGILPGETWGEAGAFSVSVLGKGAAGIDVRFAWTDSTAPAAPRLVTPRATIKRGQRRTLEITWNEPVETGSGVARYEVSVDRGPAKALSNEFLASVVRVRMPSVGRHTVRVVAVDRAGNRSAAGVRRFTVKR